MLWKHLHRLHRRWNFGDAICIFHGESDKEKSHPSLCLSLEVRGSMLSLARVCVALELQEV